MLGPVEHVPAKAVDLIPLGVGLQVVLSDGERFVADRVVLAPGSSPPVWPRPLGGLGRRWICDPWAPGALSALPPGDPVLLVGTGLTAVDVALSLQDAGHHVVATSRHGLLPEVHTDEPAGRVPSLPPQRPTARSLLAWANAAAAEVGDWVTVVESIRSHTNRLWEQISESERSRLLRHVHRKWEVLRHRMPPQVSGRIRNMQEAGQLRIVAGGINSATESLGGMVVSLGDKHLRVAAIVNCTGPTADVTRTPDQLVRCLLDRHLARPSSLGLGLETDPRGCLPQTDNKLWLVGPLRRGRLWETTAIPEIREQAALLSASIQEVRELVAV